MQTPSERGGAALEKNPAVAHVAAPTALLRVVPVAVERQLDPVPASLPFKPRQQRRVAPFGHDQVRVVSLEQPMDAHPDGLIGPVEQAPLAVDFHFKRTSPPMGGIHPPKPFEPQLQSTQGRQLVIERPGVITALKRNHLGSVTGLHLDPGQREDAPLPAIERRQHQVGVVESEVRVVAVNRAHHAAQIRRMSRADFEHPQRTAVKQAQLLHQPAGTPASRRQPLSQTHEPRLGTVHVERRRKPAVNQTAVCPVRLNEPQRHSLGGGIEVEDPSFYPSLDRSVNHWASKRTPSSASILRRRISWSKPMVTLIPSIAWTGAS